MAILIGLTGISLLAWMYLVTTAGEMANGAMPGMPEMLALRAWTARDFFLMFTMWSVMMVGMMAPTAAPVTLIYAAVARKAARENNTLPPTAIFVAGYIVMWGLFSAGATLLQWGLERAALLSATMVSSSPVLGAGILIAVGIYQWTPFKNRCLRECRAPAQYLSEHWRSGTLGAFRMGLGHGAFCLGCCAFLMLLLFVGGVMNLLWIAAIALLVLAEKVSPFGAQGGRVAGVVMILLGVLALTRFGLGS